MKISRADRAWIAGMRFCRRCFRCHQMAERSFFIGEYQFPICARCTGIAIGHVAGILASVAWDIPFAALLGVIPMAVDGGLQQLTDYESTNTRRVITGMLYGFSTASAIIRCLRLLGQLVEKRF